MFLYLLACNLEFGQKSIFRSELVKVQCSCIPWLIMLNFAQNQILGANCSKLLHSLACNVKIGRKSIFRGEKIKFRCSSIPWLIMWNSA